MQIKKLINLKSYYQRGVTLIEVSISMAVLGLILAATNYYMKDVALSSKAKSLAVDASVVAKGALSFVAQNIEEIKRSPAPSGITGVANYLTPTVNELRNLKLLGSGVADVNSVGTGWKIVVIPIACSTGLACDVKVLVATDKSVFETDGVTINTNLIGRAMTTYGLNAGSSSNLTGNIGSIYGRNTKEGQVSWTEVNPNGLVDGVFAVRESYSMAGLAQFIRHGDTRNTVIGGNLSTKGGLNINGVLTQSGVLSATGGTTIFGSLVIAKNSNTTGNVTSRLDTTVGGSLTVSGNHSVVGDSSYMGGLIVNNSTTVGSLASISTASITNGLTTGAVTSNGALNVTGNLISTGTANITNNLVAQSLVTLGKLESASIQSGGIQTAKISYASTLVKANDPCTVLGNSLVDVNGSLITCQQDTAGAKTYQNFTDSGNMNKVVVGGGSCLANGLPGELAKDSSGYVFSCVGGIWTSASKIP